MTEGTPNIDFCLLGHPASFQHMGKLLAAKRPDFVPEKLNKHRDTLIKLFEWAPSYAASPVISLTVANGRTVTGKMIVCTFLPEIIDSPHRFSAAYGKIKQACKLAGDLGAKIVGLGGFTSILAGEQGRKVAEETGVVVTSGNSLTAALALKQLDFLLDRLGWDIESKTVSILGASGDIGRACALVLAPRCKRLILIARGVQRLKDLHAELGSPAHVEISSNVQDATAASICLAATSASHPVLSENDLNPGTLVCDLGYPKNLSYSPRARKDVLLFSGGIADTPSPMDLTLYTELPSEHLIYGCFAEAMVLAATNRCVPFSIGQSQISREKMDQILEVAAGCGFHPAKLYRGNDLITDEMIDEFLHACREETRLGHTV